MNPDNPEEAKALLQKFCDEYRRLSTQSAHAEMLARLVLTLNPTSGELGEGKTRRLIELAEEVLSHD